MHKSYKVTIVRLKISVKKNLDNIFPKKLRIIVTRFLCIRKKLIWLICRATKRGQRRQMVPGP